MNLSELKKTYEQYAASNHMAPGSDEYADGLDHFMLGAAAIAVNTPQANGIGNEIGLAYMRMKLGQNPFGVIPEVKITQHAKVPASPATAPQKAAKPKAHATQPAKKRGRQPGQKVQPVEVSTRQADGSFGEPVRHPSLTQAFKALDLPVGSATYFRQKMKESGGMRAMTADNGSVYQFRQID